MQCEITLCDSVMHCTGTYSMVVPARDDPIPGVATQATLLVAPTCFHAVASAVSKSPLVVAVAVADSDGIRWRTGTTNGGNLYGGTAPTSPLQMLQSLFVAAKQIDEPPLRAAGQNESRHLALLWKDTSSMQIETESFHIFREQFRRAVPSSTALPERCDTTVYYCGDNPWGTTLFTVNNSEPCRYTVNEALEYLAGLTEPNFNDTTLRTALEQSQSGVLALAVLHLRRDLGVEFVPVTSVFGFIEEQFGSMPEAVPQQHTKQFEFWPTKGGQGLLRRCAHMQLQAQESEGCCFQLSECSDPSGLADRRLRGVVTADQAPTERTLEVQFQFWATIPAADGELVIQYVNDKAHRLEPERYQTARLRDSAATLPPLAAEQLVQLEQSCLELMDEEERAPLRSEPDRQRALAVLAVSHKTFLHMLEPLYGEHPLTKSLASAKDVFLQRFLRLQQRLYRYPADQETGMLPSLLYPGAERPRKKMRHHFSLPPSQAVRMASVGAGCLGGVSSSPLSTVASAANKVTN